MPRLLTPQAGALSRVWPSARPVSRRALLLGGLGLGLRFVGRGVAGVAPAPVRLTVQSTPTGETALTLRLDQPHGLAVGSDGAVYIADVGNHRVRRLEPDGLVTTVAGSGLPGNGGDGGPAAYADLYRCSAVAVDRAGGLYIADSGNHRIRYVGPDGVIQTIAGTGIEGGLGDGGPARAAHLAYPTGLALAADGTLYVADSRNNRIRRIALDGTIDTVAGRNHVPSESGAAGETATLLPWQAAQRGDDDGIPARDLYLVRPWDVALGPDGALYIADLFNHCIWRVDSAGTAVAVAGRPGDGGLIDGGYARQPAVAFPRGVAVATNGDLLIADSTNQRIARVDSAGTLTTVAGDGHEGFLGDGGPARLARLGDPWGMAITADGRLLITDRANRRVRQVDRLGTITTMAGGGPTDREIQDAPPSGAATE